MKNPYNKTIIDEASGIEVANRDHRRWQEGHDAARLCPTCHCDLEVWKEMFGEKHKCYPKIEEERTLLRERLKVLRELAHEEKVDSSMGKWIDPDTFVYQGVEYTITLRGEVVEK